MHAMSSYTFTRTLSRKGEFLPDKLEERRDADGLRPLYGDLEEPFTWRISICGLNLSSQCHSQKCGTWARWACYMTCDTLHG